MSATSGLTYLNLNETDDENDESDSSDGGGDDNEQQRSLEENGVNQDSMDEGQPLDDEQQIIGEEEENFDHMNEEHQENENVTQDDMEVDNERYHDDGNEENDEEEEDNDDQAVAIFRGEGRRRSKEGPAAVHILKNSAAYERLFGDLKVPFTKVMQNDFSSAFTFPSYPLIMFLVNSLILHRFMIFAVNAVDHLYLDSTVNMVFVSTKGLIVPIATTNQICYLSKNYAKK